MIDPNEDPMDINKYNQDPVKPEINYNYLGRIASTEDMAGTSGFNDPNSQQSQNTASLLNEMRAAREYHIASDAEPLSEKMFPGSVQAGEPLVLPEAGDWGPTEA